MLEKLRRHWQTLTITILLLFALSPSPIALPFLHPLQKAHASLKLGNLEIAISQLEEALEFERALAGLHLKVAGLAFDVDDIDKFTEWLPIALSKVKDTGRAYIFIGAYPREIQAYINIVMPAQILVWTYRNTLGPTPKFDYKLNWQAILYYRGKDALELDCPIMLEQFSVQDINAPDGRQYNREHTWQKPDEIAERFIRHSTKPGDLVLDPFTGTGTFLLAAAKLGRQSAGCENDDEMIKIAEERGLKCQ